MIATRQGAVGYSLPRDWDADLVSEEVTQMSQAESQALEAAVKLMQQEVLDRHAFTVVGDQ